MPQGFTLSVAGSLSITIAHHGSLGIWEAWLFVVGAGMGFLVMTLASGAHRRRHVRTSLTVTGWALLNLVPAVVVPIAGVISWSVANVAAAAFVAGPVTTAAYVTALAWFIQLTTPRKRDQSSISSDGLQSEVTTDAR